MGITNLCEIADIRVMHVGRVFLVQRVVIDRFHFAGDWVGKGNRAVGKIHWIAPALSFLGLTTCSSSNYCWVALLDTGVRRVIHQQSRIADCR